MNRPIIALLPLALCAAQCAALPCRADIILPSLFTDNMVLEQRARVNVWGRADPDESVTVQLGPDSAQTSAGKDGQWAVKLDGLKAGGPYDLTVYGKNSITIHNVAVGEVWVCAGESNMEYKVMASKNGEAEMAGADLPMVRFFMVRHTSAGQPQPDCDGAWVVCSPGTVKIFSAVGYYFAKELNQGMRMPMGIIQSTWGPSPAEAWVPHDVLSKNPAMRDTLARYARAREDYPEALSAYQAKLTEWRVAAGQAASAGSPPPRAPIQPLAPGGPREPSGLFNGMIAPLVRYPIRGVLWYQGESNTYEPALYRTLFPALIDSWRSAWDEGNFPFFYVQLPGFLARHSAPSESQWAELREAQAAALDLPKTGMAATIDLGDEHNMHPPDKQDVAHRLALIAKSEVYDDPDVIASGPVFSSMELGDGKATLSFSHVDGGLSSRNGPALRGFSIAGPDHTFHWADAQIHGDEVIVQSKEVPNPAAVRYAWADFPDCDLFNKAGLPAAPFRTDNWVPGELSTPPSPSPSPAHHRRHRAS